MPNELTQAERIRVLEQACALGLAELRLLGGEPLIHLGDTLELLGKAKTLGVKRAVVCTSAVERDFDWLMNFKAFYPMAVSAEASIYSRSGEIHDAVTLTKGSHASLLANSREAVRVGFDLHWNFVWMRVNMSELDPVVALAAMIGIKRVRILRLMLTGRARENMAALALPLELETQSQSMLDGIRERFPEVDVRHSKPLAFQFTDKENVRQLTCDAGAGQLVVEADGAVIPCIGMKRNPHLAIGNVRTHTLEELLSFSKDLELAKMSRATHECPAILFNQKASRLVQLTLN